MSYRNMFSRSRAYTSTYLGVSKHKRTGKYDVYFSDKATDNGGGKSKQGGFQDEEMAAKSYDLMNIKYKGPKAVTNFPVTIYEKELKEMQNMSRQESIHFLRRRSGSFSKGASVYRGVSRDRSGKWRAMIGTFGNTTSLHLGTFESEEEAAEAYDIAAIRYRGLSAVTNFKKTTYDVEAITKSNILPLKRKEQSTSTATQDTENGIEDEGNAVNDIIVSTINHSNASTEEPIHASPVI